MEPQGCYLQALVTEIIQVKGSYLTFPLALAVCRSIKESDETDGCNA